MKRTLIIITRKRGRRPTLHENADWLRRLIDSLTIGEIWKVPATGAVFCKTGANTLEVLDPGCDPELIEKTREVGEYAGIEVL